MIMKICLLEPLLNLMNHCNNAWFHFINDCELTNSKRSKNNRIPSLREGAREPEDVNKLIIQRPKMYFSPLVCSV